MSLPSHWMDARKSIDRAAYVEHRIVNGGSGTTAAASATIVAAPGAGKRLVLREVRGYNSSATDLEVEIGPAETGGTTQRHLFPANAPYLWQGEFILAVNTALTRESLTALPATGTLVVGVCCDVCT